MKTKNLKNKKTFFFANIFSNLFSIFILIFLFSSFIFYLKYDENINLTEKTYDYNSFEKYKFDLFFKQKFKEKIVLNYILENEKKVIVNDEFKNFINNYNEKNFNNEFKIILHEEIQPNLNQRLGNFDNVLNSIIYYNSTNNYNKNIYFYLKKVNRK